MHHLFFIALYPLTAMIFFHANEISGENQKNVDQYLTQFEIFMLVLFAPLMLKFAVQLPLAIAYSIAQRFRSAGDSAAHEPTVSVLIPAWNEEVGIDTAIRSVLDADYPKVELIVIDDGSTDGTSARVRALISDWAASPNRDARPIFFKSIANGGKAKALNVALAMASGEIVITIDADSVMHRDAIKNLVKHFKNPRVASVAGNVSVGNKSTFLGLVQQMEYLCGFFFKRADGIMNAVYIVGGAAAAYRRATIQSSGGFDEEIITEDIELSTRLQHQGYDVRYAADATIFTESPSDFRSLCLQRLRWKYGRILTFVKFRDLFFNTRRNLFLSFFVLPITVYLEFLLMFAPFLIFAFYLYAFSSGAFMALALVILIVLCVINLQILLDFQRKFHANLIIATPVAWMIFYIIDAVEFQALVRSLCRLAANKSLSWQRWRRQGVFQGMDTNRGFEISR